MVTLFDNFDYNIIRHLIKIFYSKREKLEHLEDKSIENKENLCKLAEKLLPSAIKYKEILSANKEVPVNILGLEDGVNFDDYILKRSDFEDFSINEFNRVYSPIQEILKRNNLDLIDISTLELIGGGIRIPKIKDILSEYISSDKIGFHMNGDDSIALGLGYLAANISDNKYLNKKTDFVNYGNNFEYTFTLTDSDKENLFRDFDLRSSCDEQTSLNLNNVQTECVSRGGPSGGSAGGIKRRCSIGGTNADGDCDRRVAE